MAEVPSDGKMAICLVSKHQIAVHSTAVKSEEKQHISKMTISLSCYQRSEKLFTKALEGFHIQA